MRYLRRPKTHRKTACLTWQSRVSYHGSGVLLVLLSESTYSGGPYTNNKYVFHNYDLAMGRACEIA